jgi:hypothetical protein
LRQVNGCFRDFPRGFVGRDYIQGSNLLYDIADWKRDNATRFRRSDSVGLKLNRKQKPLFLNVLLFILDSQQHLKVIACWLWALFFSFAVPELLVFIHSLRICFSRWKLWKRPRFVQFVIVFGLESVQTVGLALLVGSVLPYLSV